MKQILDELKKHFRPSQIWILVKNTTGNDSGIYWEDAFTTEGAAVAEAKNLSGDFIAWSVVRRSAFVCETLAFIDRSIFILNEKNSDDVIRKEALSKLNDEEKRVLGL